MSVPKSKLYGHFSVSSLTPHYTFSHSILSKRAKVEAGVQDPLACFNAALNEKGII